jgi:hypothetical protein
MTQPTTLTDFILHIGPNGAGDSCALLRTPGDEWIHAGHVTATVANDERFDLHLVTPAQSICLAGVLPRHIAVIRGQGLYVIQRKDHESDTQAVLLEWRE